MFKVYKDDRLFYSEIEKCFFNAIFKEYSSIRFVCLAKFT